MSFDMLINNYLAFITKRYYILEQFSVFFFFWCNTVVNFTSCLLLKHPFLVNKYMYTVINLIIS